MRRTPSPTWRWLRRADAATHRWLVLVLGLLVLVETTSGSILLYQQQLGLIYQNYSWTSPSHTATPSKHPMSLANSASIILNYHPKFDPLLAIVDSKGLYEVSGPARDYSYVVDPGTGHIIGTTTLHQTRVLTFLSNLHACGLSCKGRPGYIGILDYNIPRVNLPVGRVLLGIAAFALLYLCISGLISLRSGKKGVLNSLAIRRASSRYRRNRDLHRIVGFVAVPFLLLWALTGAADEFSFVSKTGYTLEGRHPPGRSYPISTEIGAPRISSRTAAQSALRATNGGRIVGYRGPVGSEGTYRFYVIKGVDLWKYHPQEGDRWDIAVSVDQYNADHTWITYSAPTNTPAGVLFGGWGNALHTGDAVNPIMRSVFFAAGMTPLVSAITGGTSWTIRRKRRKATGRGRGSAQHVDRSGW